MKTCKKCGNPTKIYWCKKCESTNETTKCYNCKGKTTLDKGYHDNCNGTVDWELLEMKQENLIKQLKIGKGHRLELLNRILELERELTLLEEDPN